MAKVKVMLDEGAQMPTRAHEADAGYDIYSPVDRKIKAKGHTKIDTGLHIQIPLGYTGFLKSRSGLNIKFCVTTEGVIDSGYTGSIVVKLYNNRDRDYYVSRGDKIAQLVLLPIFTPELELAESLDESERGDNGFGSTGR